ncbi:MAG: acetyl-CoA carboxylase, carboxyltransferase subunit beta [Clostridiales bacterium]|nr:acetyl-CoA carboxylase, carboxyltransferase subunit beta [Clostridiales bacterium]
MLKTILNIKESILSARQTKKCKNCGKELSLHTLKKNNMICPECGTYFRMNARERINMICDSFTEADASVTSGNIINFPGYDDKLAAAKNTSGENESVICGTCKISGCNAVIFVMNSEFMMGSLGSAAGEKITRAFEYAAEHKLPVIGFTCSGGARMQEGIFSLMQMAKVSAAVKRHSDAGLLYITVLTDPTTGGVTASYAMEGDIIIAEPKALVGFAGARVIEQTTNQKLPEGFQSAEFLLEHGFVDFIEKRENLKSKLAEILKIHCG